MDSGTIHTLNCCQFEGQSVQCRKAFCAVVTNSNRKWETQLVMHIEAITLYMSLIVGRYLAHLFNWKAVTSTQPFSVFADHRGEAVPLTQKLFFFSPVIIKTLPILKNIGFHFMPFQCCVYTFSDYCFITAYSKATQSKQKYLQCDNCQLLLS